MTGSGLATEKLRRVYDNGDETVVALDDVDLVVPGSTTAAIVGPSGSGKSTLVTILAGLQRPTSGRVLLGDLDLSAMTERELLAVRAGPLSVVAQNPNRNLLPYGTATDNIVFAGRGARGRRRPNLPQPIELLARLNLSAIADVQADRLSGGERQRLALAAGLASRPDLLLADEPTSQLDGWNRDAVAELLGRINQEFGTTILVVTHDQSVADSLDRSFRMAGGRLAEATERSGV
jgi:ABC-type lipoprotein export system ATPase subunit